jgi:hypothetical protein
LRHYFCPPPDKSNIITMKNRSRKRVQLFFSSIFICLLHLPFVFAKTKSKVAGAAPETSFINLPLVNDIPIAEEAAPVNSPVINSVYDSLKLASAGLSRQVFEYAIRGFDYLKQKGKIGNPNIITIADFSKTIKCCSIPMWPMV